MPPLKRLRCEIEWSNTKIPFPEYGTKYGDGLVETYIPIPDHPQPFAVHLTSTKYIAEGLALLVFMDGDYQCNRNRLDLQPPGPSSLPSTLIDMRVRQKEKPLGDGVYLGRGWRFDTHNIVPVDQLPDNVDRHHFLDIGTISVFVLRCRAKSTPILSPTTSSNIDDSAQSSPRRPATQPSSQNNVAHSRPADVHHFGLDGEGLGPPDDRAWSWTAPNPSYPSGPPPALRHMPAQPPHPQPPTMPHSYAELYGPPFASSQSWQPGPAVHQDPPTIQRPQRHVHFTDKPPQLTPGVTARAQGYNAHNIDADVRTSPEHVVHRQQHAQEQVPRDTFAPQAATHAPLAHAYANPSLSHFGIPIAQDQNRGVPLGFQAPYQPPMTRYQNPAYGFPGYPAWSSTTAHPQHEQHAWSAQSMPAASYPTGPSLAPHFQSSYPHPHSQYSYPVNPVPSVAPHLSNHPGGGIWGPPQTSQSQDHGKDETNGLDGEGKVNQETAGNANEGPNEDNNQGWDQPDSWQTQPDNSIPNGAHEAGGTGQPQSWSDNPDHTGASNVACDQSGNLVPGNYGEDSWNTNENGDGPGQDSWANGPITTPADASTFTFPQQASSAPRAVANERPLWGPHGAYYRISTANVEGGPVPDAGEEPLYDVPADMSTTHQVKPGEGYTYYHKRRSPEYIDSLEDPYAHFIFKYRTKEQIEQETGLKVEDGLIGHEKKRELQMMEKDQLVEMLLQTKDALGGRVPPLRSSGPRPGEYSHGSGTNVGPTVVPAPVHNFLDYEVPPARRPSNSASSFSAARANMGFSSSDSGNAPPDGTRNPQAWTGQNNNNNHQASNNATTTTASSSASSVRTSHHHNPKVDSWGQRTGPAQAPQRAYHQTQAQPQSHPYQPLQFDNTVHTYRPGTSTTTTTATAAAAPGARATDRPITPPNGGWNAQYHSAQSSSSDNGMAGWNADSAATAAGGAGGAGSWGNGSDKVNANTTTTGNAGVGTGTGTGTGTGEAPYQPVGGW